MPSVTYHTKNPPPQMAQLIEDSQGSDIPVLWQPWIAEWDMVRIERDENGVRRWSAKPDDFMDALIDVRDEVPIGSPEFPTLMLDWERLYVHPGTKRRDLMYDFTLTARAILGHRVGVGYYDLPPAVGLLHRQGIRRDYESCYLWQTAFFPVLYSHGAGKRWEEQDDRSIHTLLDRTASVADGRPVTCYISTRRGYRQGWERLSDDRLRTVCQRIVGDRWLGATISIFGAEQYRARIASKADQYEIDPSVIPTPAGYDKELCNLIEIAREVTKGAVT